MKFIWEEEFKITSADTDFSKKLSVPALTNMFIQVAWHHAEELGFGIGYLNENGLAWVLSRFHIIIDQYPEWNEDLKFVTWPKGIRRLFYLRDLEVFNKKGDLIARATSEWLLIDIKTKRPKLQGPDESIFNKNKDKHAIGAEIENIKFPEGNYSTFDNRSYYSDIDLNQHLTTTRYFDWIFDTYDMNFHREYQCKELVANFSREISFGEMIQIRRFDLQVNKFSSVFSFQSNSEVEHFKGKIDFKEK